MLQSRLLTPTTTPTALQDLLDWPQVRGFKGIQLQAPAANASVINYGGHDGQLFTLAAGLTTDVLPIPHLNDLKVFGNGTDTLRIMTIG